jgi:membrane-associated protein
MDFIHSFTDGLLHLDRYVDGVWLYAILFAIIFCETGLVVTPFLPGDSLLFAVGALTAQEEPALELWSVMALLIAAGVLGDAVNYSIGRYVGPKVFSRENSWLLNKKHLLRTHAFYERYGGKTIFLARFIPIVRTFAPFVAGVGTMGYRRFAVYNIAGAVVWVLLFTLAGHYFSQTPLVRNNFQLVILAIIAISVLPMAVEYLRARAVARGAASHDNVA